jgi:hypothetical protein
VALNPPLKFTLWLRLFDALFQTSRAERVLVVVEWAARHFLLAITATLNFSEDYFRHGCTYLS